MNQSMLFFSFCVSVLLQPLYQPSTEFFLGKFVHTEVELYVSESFLFSIIFSNFIRLVYSQTRTDKFLIFSRSRQETRETSLISFISLQRQQVAGITILFRICIELMQSLIHTVVATYKNESLC